MASVDAFRLPHLSEFSPAVEQVLLSMKALCYCPVAICYRRQVIEELVWSEISYHTSSLLFSSRSEWYGRPCGSLGSGGSSGFGGCGRSCASGGSWGSSGNCLAPRYAIYLCSLDNEI